MNWMDKLERKIGRYAVPNLMLYIIIMYGAGYVLYLVNPALWGCTVSVVLLLRPVFSDGFMGLWRVRVVI